MPDREVAKAQGFHRGARVLCSKLKKVRRIQRLPKAGGWMVNPDRLYEGFEAEGEAVVSDKLDKGYYNETWRPHAVTWLARKSDDRAAAQAVRDVRRHNAEGVLKRREVSAAESAAESARKATSEAETANALAREANSVAREAATAARDAAEAARVANELASLANSLSSRANNRARDANKIAIGAMIVATITAMASIAAALLRAPMP
jgi:hypothetical protein